MIKDFVLCARAVEKNKFLSEPGPSFPLLATRSTFVSSEQSKWSLPHPHNRKAMGESVQGQYSIHLDSPDESTPEHNSIIRKKNTITRDGICFANSRSTTRR
ncbi:hypothetical protein [Nitrospira lenta]|uniref:hypothetical protein n=1 Tax=Nitrospira lenta TaxID=1436998 RepID=UPI0011B800BA|nr:hypothetical protein [Nitrospira lenta]